jgi:hypothetical protein
MAPLSGVTRPGHQADAEGSPYATHDPGGALCKTTHSDNVAAAIHRDSAPCSAKWTLRSSSLEHTTPHTDSMLSASRA